jgi:transposase
MHRTSDPFRFHAVPRVLDACFDVGGSELHLLTEVDGRKYQRSIRNRTEEIELLLGWLGSRAKLEGYSNVRVVVEPTGVYHELLLRMVRTAGMSAASAPPPATHGMYVMEMSDAWQDLFAAERRKERAQAMLEELYDRARELDPSLPAPQKGLASKLSLARLIAETGRLSDFASWREVLKYIGLNLRERQSGRYRGKTRVSKKGRALARHVLNQMVVPLVKRTRLLGPWYRHMIDVEKKPGPVAITAAARKLVKILWGWSRSGQEFNPARVFSCSAEYKAAA